MSNQEMKAPFFIEVLTSNQRLLSRHRFDALPIKIGRGYNNHLILDDAYVSSNHAVVELSETGRLSIRDLDSDNGLLSGDRLESQIIIDDQPVCLGKSHIRVRHANFDVGRTLLHSNEKKSIFDNSAWKLVTVSLLLFFFVFLLHSWLASQGEISYVSFISEASLFVMLLIVWSGIWGGIRRLMGNEGDFKFAPFLLIAVLSFISFDLLMFFILVVSYAFSAEFLAKGELFVACIFIAIALFFHLKEVSRGRKSNRLLLISAFFGLACAGVAMLLNYQEYDNLMGKQYMSHILFPELRVSPDKSVDEFFNEVEALKNDLDEARKKPASTE